MSFRVTSLFFHVANRAIQRSTLNVVDRAGVGVVGEQPGHRPDLRDGQDPQPLAEQPVEDRVTRSEKQAPEGLISAPP
jgi:hypothetical protein